MTKHPHDYFINLLPGVPVIESPFFANMLDAGYFSAYERDIAIDLNKYGYAVIDFPDPDIFTRAERISAALQPLFDAARQSNDNHGGKLIPPRFQDAHCINSDVKEIANNAAIIELLSKLYGRRAFPFQTLNFEKGSQQHFHSDAVHFHSYPEKFMCGVWVALEDITLENGPLHYYPGSHKWAVYANEHLVKSGDDLVRPAKQDIYHDLWKGLVESTRTEKRVFLAKKGQALIWCAYLLHGGEKILDANKSRWSQVTHYFFENCAYYTPMSSHIIAGKINFRRPNNILTQQATPPVYAGIALPDKYVHNNIHSDLLANAEVKLRRRRIRILSYLNKRLQRFVNMLILQLHSITSRKVP